MAPLLSFLKIISRGPGGTVTNYSPRFSLTGMKGTFPPEVVAGIQKVSGTDGPPTEKTGGDPPKPGANIPSASFAIPFASQTGAIFYAPMQKRPGTKITAKNAKPLYPTSSVIFATGFLPTPKQTTTYTATMTISTESRAHTVRRPVCPSQPLTDGLIKASGKSSRTTKRPYAEVFGTLERLMEWAVKLHRRFRIISYRRVRGWTCIYDAVVLWRCRFAFGYAVRELSGFTLTLPH
jgi:hypothetical protein